MNVGSAIRRIRQAREMLQVDLAARSCLSVTFISLLENGRRSPNVSTLSRIAESLSLPVEAILWEAVDLPSGLNRRDRRLCETAKLIVRQLYCPHDHPRRRRTSIRPQPA